MQIKDNLHSIEYQNLTNTDFLIYIELMFNHNERLQLKSHFNHAVLLLKKTCILIKFSIRMKMKFGKCLT